jgi:predicted LPLAT superfamily acyltransferase
MFQIVRERNHLLTKGWLHTFIGRHLDQLEICRSLPQEDTRMNVPRAHVEEHIQLVKFIIAEKFFWAGF